MRRSALLLTSLLLIACGGGDSKTITTPTVAVASVSVAPASGAIAIGATVQLAAVTKDASGSTLTGRTISWSSANAATATVSAAGLVTGVAAGSAYIRATSESKSDSTQVTVASPNLTYSAWKITANAGATSETPVPADLTDDVLTRARSAYTALKSFWTTPTAGAAIPTLWVVPVATTIGTTSSAAGLFISDSLPGTATAGREPALYTFATPNAASVATVDDSTLAAKWALTGTAASFTMTAQFPDLENSYIPNYPHLIFECIGTFRSPYVIYTVAFTGNGATGTGSGTLTYTFRDFTPSCQRPLAVKAKWTMTIPFTATRVR